MIIVIRTVLNPIQYLDGLRETVRVVVLNADRSVANTGRGFEHMYEAELFADGLGMAYGPRTLREYENEYGDPFEPGIAPEDLADVYRAAEIDPYFD